MKKFEYKIFNYSLSELELNNLGIKGWELMFVRGNSFYFKREITTKFQDTDSILDDIPPYQKS